MLTKLKCCKIIKAINNTLKIIKISSGQIKIETKLELQAKNIFKKQSDLFWKLEYKNVWLNKCYLKAQQDLSEIKKMGMSKNPEDRIDFIANLTEEWYDDIDNDKILNKTLKNTYVSGYNFAGQEVLDEFKIKEKFNLRSLKVLEALDNRANLTSDQIDLTSWELIQNRIADSFWKEGKNVDKAATDIRDLFESTYKNRAETIARTETGEIVSEATFESYKEMDIEEMEWGAELDACELCFPLDGQIVKVGESFNNGLGWTGTHPLVHPNCRCFTKVVVPENFIPANYWTGD
jgi:SPP1 gp7 family putative phage head morphogenesis protein